MSTDYRKDIQFIRALADLIEKSNLNEIEVERDTGENEGMRVRLSKSAPQLVQMAPAALPTSSMQHLTAPAIITDIASDAENFADHPGMVFSPMVGTVYLAPEPGAADFVKVGDKVTEGQTILIIEAMKTMNQIPAPHAGTVTKIIADNQQPIDFGAALMIIE